MSIRIPPTRALALLAAVTVVAVVVSASLLVWEMRKRDLERERLDTASMAHMMREETLRTFESADGVLRGVVSRMETPFGASLQLDGTPVRLLLGARALSVPQVDVVAISDASGNVVNASQADARLAPSIAGTAYFKAFAAGHADLFIDRPVLAAPGEWTLDMARPFTDARGRLRGVAVLTMKVPRLEEFQQRMDPDRGRHVALYLLDGTLIAASPARDALIGERAPELGTQQLSMDGSGVRTTVRGSREGASGTFALARAGAFPLVVGVYGDNDTVLASWRERALSLALGAILVCAFVVAAAAVIAGEMRREARLARALRDANDRYHRTIESLMDAIVSVDASQRVTLFNPAAERMFGVRAGDVLGQPIARFIPPRLRDAHAAHMGRFLDAPGTTRGMEFNRDVSGVRADGTEFPLETTLARTVVDGQPEVTAVLRDVTDRRRAEQELFESNRQLRALSSSLQEVREQERTRIAAELHDELGQQLTGLKLELSWLASRVKDGRGVTIEQVDSMRHQLDGTIASVRRIATELRPRVLDDLELSDALAWQAGEFSRRTGLKVDVAVPAAARVTDPDTATALFRIVQESLTNVARHANASAVRVRLEEEGGDLVLSIADDGRGLPGGGAPGGLGLVGIRERALALGGRLKVNSTPGVGTSLEVTLPLRAVEEGEEAAA